MSLAERWQHSASPKWLMVGLAMVLAVAAENTSAGTTEVFVAEMAQDTYRISPTGEMILTAPCYHMAAGEFADLESSGVGGKLSFKEPKESCAVQFVLRHSPIRQMRKKVVVLRRARNWYEVLGMNLHIRTLTCTGADSGEESLLEIQSEDSGRLTFKDQDDCEIFGTYETERR